MSSLSDKMSVAVKKRKGAEVIIAEAEAEKTRQLRIISELKAIKVFSDILSSESTKQVRITVRLPDGYYSDDYINIDSVPELQAVVQEIINEVAK